MSTPTDNVEAAHLEIMKQPGVRDYVSFAAGNMDPLLSKAKGRCIYYPIDEKFHESSKAQEMELSRICQQYTRSMKLNALPEYKYPFATPRITGRTWPGEERR